MAGYRIICTYGVAPEHVVTRKLSKYNEKTGKTELTDTRFRVESVDHSLMTTDEDGNIYGIVDVQMSIDTRPYND